MKRAVLLLAVVALAGCSDAQQRSEEDFVAAVADIPGEPRAKMVIGDMICGEIRSHPAGDVRFDLAVDLTGEIYNSDQAAILIDAADTYLCP